MKPSIDELNEILEKHRLWLEGEDGGERAVLSRADLSESDLSESDLRRANLYGANLYGANLRGANLHGANLHGAYLRGANLYGANLRGADLRESDLRESNLRESDLYGAYLRGANLYGAFCDVLSVGPIGSRHGVTYYLADLGHVQCGCFRGTLDEFAAKVETEHADRPVYLAEYRAATAFFKAVKEARERFGERGEE